MPTTSNFGWTTPADTDLVKDGAAAIRTLGNGIDTSFLDLKGGTTDQVLAKNSNTDLDFKWVAADDADAIQKSLIDAEGDLIVGDAADAVQRLAIGSNGNVLTVDTAVDGKIKWAAPAGGGKVLQVVYGSTTASTTIATTTFTDTGITATITPSATTSKVLVLTMCALYVDRQTTTADADARIMRDATELLATGTDGRFYLTIVDTATRVRFNTYSPLNYLDSPSTTSAVTYKVQGRISTTTNSGTSTWQLSSCPSNIILMEIGA